jgi:hypothetical protein
MAYRTVINGRPFRFAVEPIFLAERDTKGEFPLLGYSCLFHEARRGAPILYPSDADGRAKLFPMPKVVGTKPRRRLPCF